MNYKKITLFFWFVMIMISMSAPSLYFIPSIRSSSLTPYSSVSVYWNLIENPIFIDDSDPTNDWAKTVSENLWCTGTGTSEDPYIIQNLYVFSSTLNCITIQNSDAYFFITNCIIEGPEEFQIEKVAGVHLDNVKNGYITNSQIVNGSFFGIEAVWSTDILIYNNYLFNNYVPIYLGGCLENEVSLNTIVNNEGGVELYWSNHSLIQGNNIYNNEGYGVWSGACSNNEISYNTISNCRSGVYLGESSVYTITQNIIEENEYYGILLKYESNYNTSSYNSVSNTPYCIGVGESCFENNICNNGDCPIYIVDDIWISLDDNDDDNEEDDNNTETIDDGIIDIYIPGFNFIILFAISFVVSSLLIIRMKLRY